VFRARSFVGHGDADPSNVSPLVRGAELRVAETRAVNRVEEIGSPPPRSQAEPNVRKLPPQPVNGNGEPKLRDQLCLLIRQHRLDVSRVKQYAAEFCYTRDLQHTPGERMQRFSPSAVFSSFLLPIWRALPCGQSRTCALVKASPLELCRPSTHPASPAIPRRDFSFWPQAYQIKVPSHAKATAKNLLTYT